MEATILKSYKCDNVYKVDVICPICGNKNTHGSDTKGLYYRGCHFKRGNKLWKGSHEYSVII